MENGPPGSKGRQRGRNEDGDIMDTYRRPWSTEIAEGTGAGGEGGFAELWGNASSVETDVGSSLVGRFL